MRSVPRGADEHGGGAGRNPESAGRGVEGRLLQQRVHRHLLHGMQGVTGAIEGEAEAGRCRVEQHDDGLVVAGKAHYDEAGDLVADAFGEGLNLDIHGHGHEIPRVEIGYLLSRALRNELRRGGLDREVSCFISEVVVDAKDPLNRRPTKPIGPFMSEAEARQRAADPADLFQRIGRRHAFSQPVPNACQGKLQQRQCAFAVAGLLDEQINRRREEIYKPMEHYKIYRNEITAGSVKVNGVEVRGVDVNASGWDCALEKDEQGFEAACGLGFPLMVKPALEGSSIGLARADDPAAYFEALQEAGYATDPNYARKVLSVLDGGAMQRARDAAVEG